MDAISLQEEVNILLQRIGWHESDLKQIEVYAKMPSEKKVQQMLRLRAEQVRFLKARLRAEHPDYSEAHLRQMFLEHLDLVREKDKVGF